MSYISLNKNDYIITEKDVNLVGLDGNNLCGGFEERNYEEYPFGSFADPFPEDFYIPSSEWIERIEEMDAKKAQPIHHRESNGIKSLGQASTNFCWINCVCQGVHYARAMKGLDNILLSPASVGAPMTRYRNRGGWPSEGVNYLKTSGFVPQSLWPPNAIERKYNTSEADEQRPRYTILESYELPNRSYEALISGLLRGSPIPIGVLWWRHAILACGLKVQGSDPESDIMVCIDNSWNNWGSSWEPGGNKGLGFLNRQKATPDDAILIADVVSS